MMYTNKTIIKARGVSRFTGCQVRIGQPLPAPQPPLDYAAARELLLWAARMYTPAGPNGNGGRPARGWTRLSRETGIPAGHLYEMANGTRTPCLPKIASWWARKQSEIV